MEVETISRHCIKPCSPTPKHLQIHKLSLLDQFVPSIYTPMILFYSNSTTNCDHHHDHHRLQVLKESLSQALTTFYPLAGRIKDKFSIDCNDQGVSYTESKANFSLLEFLNQPGKLLSSLLHKFLPIIQPNNWVESSSNNEGVHVAMIQVTTFSCGGLAIGVIMSHKIADGVTMSFFLKSWAAMARNSKAPDPLYASPTFHAAPSIFPLNHDARDSIFEGGFMAVCGPFLKSGKSTTRRFSFGPAELERLRAQASSFEAPNPTRVEAVSALIWKCMTSALKAKCTLVTHSVNLRRRAVPTFPESYMGNFQWAASATSSSSDDDVAKLVIKLREAIITKVNGEFVKSLKGEGGRVKYGEALKEMVEETASLLESKSNSHGVAYVAYSSWCRFGHYDVDFGWGKPTWATCTGSSESDRVFVNGVVLMDTPSGDGIEAWVYLEEGDMAVSEQDKDLLAFAALDLNPLLLNTLSHHT